MKKVFLTFRPYLMMGAMAVALLSCSDDNETEIEQETEVTQSEVTTVLEADELSSAADDVVRELFNADQSGQSAKVNDCYQAEYSDTGFTVSFDNCSVEENGEVYNGSLSVIYGTEGDSFAYSINFDNLTVGAIALDGTRSFAFSGNEDNSIVFEVTSDMTLTLADGSVISEKGSKTFAIVFAEEFGEGMLTLEGDWTLVADGNTYTVSISQLLEADFGCNYIGKGLMELNKNGLEVSVDFGDGSCDDVAALNYPDGTVEVISLKK